MKGQDNNSDPVLEALNQFKAKGKNRLPERTQLAQDAPAPRLSHLIAEKGERPVHEALSAWDERLRGIALVDIAFARGITIEGAKYLIREAHAAIHEDLKENLELNRRLDLDRIDGLLQTFYPAAKAGDEKSAGITLKCLERRAKLTGAEPEAVPGRSHPENVLVWIQAQMPSITKLVDALPLELAPGAPV
jgi:hypothetical protein